MTVLAETISPNVPAPAAATKSKGDFRAIAAAYQAKRLAKIPSDWILKPEHRPDPSVKDVRGVPRLSGILTAQELEITETPTAAILSNLRSGAWTSVAVTTAFCKRAAIAHQVVNCLSDIFFDTALERAKFYDDHFAKTGKPFGPLAGLPVSLKDNFNLKGHDSTIGFVAWIDQPAEYDSTLVELLLSQGAVLYCKATTPTAMMIAETVSNANGRTLNPLNRGLTPGGSSGGESALIAMIASPLGVGTDIGGSIRIPCSFTGLWGLRPSLGRFPTHRCKSALAGQEAVNSVNGPMAQHYESLHAFAETVVGAQPWLKDPKCVPMPWSPVTSLPSKLTLLMIRHDGIAAPTPPIARALEHAATSLRNAGHTVLEWDILTSSEGSSIFIDGVRLIETFFTAEGGETIHGIMEQGGEADAWVTGLTRSTLQPLPLAQAWKKQAARTLWCGDVLDKIASFGEIDNILAPNASEVATEHDALHHIFYTGAWNVADCPGVTFPVPGLKVDAKLDAKDLSYKPVHEYDQKVYDQYQVDKVEGMPICLQLVGRRLQEKALAVAKRVYDVLEVAQ